MRFGDILVFFATFLLVVHVLSYFFYFFINSDLAYFISWKKSKTLEKSKIKKIGKNFENPKNWKLEKIKKQIATSISLNLSMKYFGEIWVDWMIFVLNVLIDI